MPFHSCTGIFVVMDPIIVIIIQAIKLASNELSTS